MRNYGVVAVLVVGTLVVAAPVAISLAAKQVVDTARIELSEPMEIDAFITSVKGQAFDEMILESTFEFDGEEVYDFQIVHKGDQNQNVAAKYAHARKAMIADVKGTTEFSQEDKEQIENIKIRVVKFTGTRGNIDKVKKNLKIKKVETADDEMLRYTQPERKPEPKKVDNFFITTVEAAGTQFYPMYKYLPTSGTSYINNSSVSGERYTLQYMEWDNNYFAADETYEHKLYLYNYDDDTFLNGDSSLYPGCFPTLTYAATTWGSASKPYVDTRLAESGTSCETDELSYTIGAAQADEISTNTRHYTYMRTTYGDDNTDDYKLQAQVGFRNPSSCYSTWCAAKYKIYNLISAWENVPAADSWTFLGVAPQEAPSNLSISDLTSSSLKLHFTDNTFDETTIRIERRVAGGSWSEWGYFGLLNYTGNWNWTNTGLQSDTTYCYRLRAKNDLGYSSYSNIACATTN